MSVAKMSFFIYNTGTAGGCISLAINKIVMFPKRTIIILLVIEKDVTLFEIKTVFGNT